LLILYSDLMSLESDILQLIRMNNIDPKDDEMRDLFVKYKSEKFIRICLMSGKKKEKSFDLNLPIIKNNSSQSIRSIDEVVEWIAEMYADVFDRKIYEEEKKRLSVNVRFSLKD